MTGPLSGRRVLITGGSSGIGAATAAACRTAGAAVACVGRDPRRLETVADQLGVVTVVGDVADDASIGPATAEAAERLGGLDALVNSAGLMLHSPLRAGLVEDWRAMVEVNVLGPLYASHAALPHLTAAGGGDIVVISSTSASATVRVPDFSLYAATKAALRPIVEGLRLECAALNIRVATVVPGYVDTPGFGPGIRDDALRQRTEATKRAGLAPATVGAEIARILALPPEVEISDLVVSPRRS